MDKRSGWSFEEDPMEEMEDLAETSIENLAQHFFDSYERENAAFRRSSGLKVTVIREELGDCCSWCADLAGVYEYGSEPKDVWARHANCRCMVVTKTERGNYQDAWSRKEYESQREAEIARKQEIEDEILSERSKRLTGSQKELYQYGKNAINVDMEYINTQEYRMKYHGISDSTKVDDIIYEQAKAILEHRSGTYFEDLVLVDAKTGEVVLAHRDSNINNKVKYTKDIEKAIKKANQEKRKLIAIHNHPEGYPPTADDAVSALVRGYAKGVACGHNGKVYIYPPAKYKMRKEDCEAIHKVIESQYIQGTDIDKHWNKVLKIYQMSMEAK